MKCVQVVGQGIPVRLTNEDAFQLVERDKDGEYCPKHVWREHWATQPGGLSAGFGSIGAKKRRAW
jgi:hypothetical protein